MRKEYERLRPTFDNQLPKQCANCESIADLQIHHIVPLSLGGRNILTNLVRLCSECHSKAHGGNSLIENAAKSRRSNIRKGMRYSPKVLFGYIYEGDAYVIHEPNAEVVRLVFRLRYEAEYSTINIATILNHMAVPTAGGANEWKHPTIKRMLDNPQYLGKCAIDGEVLDDVYPAVIGEAMQLKIDAFNRKYQGKRLPPRNIDAYLKQK